MLFLAGFRVMNAGTFPEWEPRNPFKATRDAVLRDATRPVP